MKQSVLVITSWENDADHWKSEVQLDLCQADIDLLVNIAEQFGRDRYGNKTHCEEFYSEILLSMQEKHPNVSERMKSQIEIYLKNNDAYSFMCDYVLGQPVESDWQFARVVESATVVELGDYTLEDKTPEWVRDNPQDAWNLIEQMNGSLKELKRLLKDK